MDAAINYTVEQIAEIAKGKIIQQNSNAFIGHLLLDSRKVLFPTNTIFFALNSDYRKGAEFIKNLYEKDVSNFVTDNPALDLSLFPSATFILVEDVLSALQLLAIHHRNTFTIPVLGLTGSNGKTIVKEWLYQLLQPDFTIARSPKSYNSQVGVPLSILHTDDQSTLAIFEAGISRAGEMEKLEKMIVPSIGVITNVGEAHSEGFRDRAQKTGEKLKLFARSSALIFCADDKQLLDEINILKEKNLQLQFFTWSRTGAAELQIDSEERENNRTVITALYRQAHIRIQIPFTDEASIENAITCWCVLLKMNVTPEVIAQRMLQLHPVEMRLQLKHGINRCSVINDSYSADVNSLKIALDFLHQQKQHKKQTVILSDILQSGKPEEVLYREVAALLQQKKVDRLIAIGPQMNLQRAQFSFLPEKHFFNSVAEFKSHFSTFHFADETILLKGARIFEFESIDHLLEQKVHQTILSINLNSIAHNLKYYQGLLKPGVKIMAMVKAFSYGSGSYEIANLLQFNNVDYLAVAYADEGVELRKAGINVPIIVMNPEENTFNSLVQYNLEPEIFSYSILLALEKYLDSSGLQYFPVHIKLDTGMHRLGFEPADISVLKNHLKNNFKIKVQSVFSHLAASDDAGYDNFTERQAVIFLEGCKELQDVLDYSFLEHLANTSAISRFAHLQMDMVRPGIGLYGIDSSEAARGNLRNVSTLTTTVAQVKKVGAGESVGYGCKAILPEDATIATVRIGYADGYPRSLSNGIGKMLVDNKQAPVIGNVCMDMTMLDVTGINCKEGDHVIVFGEQLPLQLLAGWANTIPYEIMTGVSARVKRVYFEE